LYKTLSSIFFISFLVISGSVYGQQSLNTAGGNAGTNVQISYTVGQPFYSLHQSTEGRVREGVQQPVFIIIPPLQIYRQEVFASSGTTAYGSNGAVSYTFGQSFYVTKSTSTGKSRDGIQQPVPPVFMNIRVFIQGFYQQGLGNMVEITGPGITDTITVAIHSSLAPYAEIFSTRVLLDINGYSQVRLPALLRGNEYYLAIRHRNALQTWSKYPVALSTGNLFDFTQ
jgi:hypothetical protein